MQQWRIRIRGEQRKQPVIDLLVQAVIAIARQLDEESQTANTATEQTPTPPDIEPRKEEL